jgi:hypothetical protein
MLPKNSTKVKPKIITDELIRRVQNRVSRATNLYLREYRGKPLDEHKLLYFLVAYNENEYRMYSLYKALKAEEIKHLARITFTPRFHLYFPGALPFLRDQKFIHELLKEVPKDHSFYANLLKQVKDQEILKRLFNDATEDHIKRRVLGSIKDQEFLFSVIAKENKMSLKYNALDNLEDPKLLEGVVSIVREKEIRHYAKAKLETYEAARHKRRTRKKTRR